VLAQSVVHSRRADDVAEATETSPAQGLARSFNSSEATQRLAALTAVHSTANPELSTTQVLRTLQQPARRRWGKRDASVIAGAAMLGLIAAALILKG
jgi:ferric-dicitrate binding protein FerR (iron transport regulator)